jgi:hypothetical protein
MSEQVPSVGRIVYYLGDGTIRVVEDDDIEGFAAPGEAVIDLAEGAPAYDEGNMYKDLFRHWPERV